jgi:hypothetical protein
VRPSAPRRFRSRMPTRVAVWTKRSSVLSSCAWRPSAPRCAGAMGGAGGPCKVITLRPPASRGGGRRQGCPSRAKKGRKSSRRGSDRLARHLRLVCRGQATYMFRLDFSFARWCPAPHGYSGFMRSRVGTLGDLRARSTARASGS